MNGPVHCIHGKESGSGGSKIAALAAPLSRVSGTSPASTTRTQWIQA